MEPKLRTFFREDCADLGFSNVLQCNFWQQRLDFLPRHFLRFRQEAPERVGNYLAGTVPVLISLLTPSFDHRQNQFFRWCQQDGYPSGVVWNSLFPRHVTRPRTQLLINHNNVIMTLWKALIAVPDKGLTNAQTPHNSFRPLERTTVLTSGQLSRNSNFAIGRLRDRKFIIPKPNLDSREKAGSQS